MSLLANNLPTTTPCYDRIDLISDFTMPELRNAIVMPMRKMANVYPGEVAHCQRVKCEASGSGYRTIYQTSDGIYVVVQTTDQSGAICNHIHSNRDYRPTSLLLHMECTGNRAINPVAVAQAGTILDTLIGIIAHRLAS